MNQDLENIAWQSDRLNLQERHALSGSVRYLFVLQVAWAKSLEFHASRTRIRRRGADRHHSANTKTGCASYRLRARQGYRFLPTSFSLDMYWHIILKPKLEKLLRKKVAQNRHIRCDDNCISNRPLRTRPYQEC